MFKVINKILLSEKQLNQEECLVLGQNQVWWRLMKKTKIQDTKDFTNTQILQKWVKVFIDRSQCVCLGLWEWVVQKEKRVE